MSGSHRLPSGGLIDRARPLHFRFDGRDLTGSAGDTLASALIANGVGLVGRSFKYHRPRGILSAGPEEPNALVELRSGARREPNTKATTAELFDGLEALSQNRWPSLHFDFGAVTGLFSPLLHAGFYYKTFMWPASFWERVYEPLIRRAAGLGRAPAEPDPDRYEKAFAFCDVLVIGGGPAGLAAALAAGRAGARVILADEDFRPGGRALAERDEIDGQPGWEWVQDAFGELLSLPNVNVMPRTTVFGVYDGGVYGAVERVTDHLAQPLPHQVRQRGWRIVAKRAVLAAGAIERPIAFGGNDRPGVMLAGAVRAYLNRWAAAAGKQVVVFTAGDDGWRTARDAAAAGLHVVGVVDARASADPALPGDLARGGTRIFSGGRVLRTFGAGGVTSVEIAHGGGRESLTCDVLAVSGGWNPSVALTTHLGGKPRWDEAIGAFRPGALPAGLTVAGACAGDLTLSAALRDGHAAGRAAAGETGASGSAGDAPTASDEPSSIRAFWRVRDSIGKAFVDHQNDVTVEDILLSEQEGYRSVEHLKRYTTLGMATDQGKTANVLGLAIMAEARGLPIPAVGTTVSRPPWTPVAIGALAGTHRGRDFRPFRLSPSHAWAAETGASFVEAGPWLRPEYFARPGEKTWKESCDREVLAVRGGVGVCDVSTLGKIDIQGEDAAEFLERVYINAWKTLAVGRARYGLMLRDDGFVFDDGTTSRLGPTHFLMTTTTANAGAVMQHLEFCAQGLWPDLDVRMVSVSEQWAQYAVAGPRSRDVLARVVDQQHDLSNEAFPYMAAAEVTALGGRPARLFRISFSGELAYELAMPARYGDALARAIMAAGGAEEITPYGLEALNVMRIEKGHVTGSELNGLTTAADLGFGRMMSTKKDYIGRVMAGREALADPARPCLVGLKPVDPAGRLVGGAHLLPVGAPSRIEHDEGYVTSACWSPVLGHAIALGLLARGRERHGERVRAVDLLRGADVEVEVCDPVFIDPKGERLRV